MMEASHFHRANIHKIKVKFIAHAHFKNADESDKNYIDH